MSHFSSRFSLSGRKKSLRRSLLTNPFPAGPNPSPRPAELLPSRRTDEVLYTSNSRIKALHNLRVVEHFRRQTARFIIAAAVR